jgi:hypothetical protein
MNNDTSPNSMAAGPGAPGMPARAVPVIAEDSNLPLAVVGGFIAALIGAFAWAIITVITKYQIGFMAVGVGFLVAWAVRTLGKGHTQVFGIIGGGFALFGCLLGNLLSACGFIAADRGVPIVSVAMKVLATPPIALSIVQATFNGMDLLFYAIAVYEGYKLARRRPA